MHFNLHSDKSLSAANLNNIFGVCDRFEAAYRAGTPHAIKQALQEVEEEMRQPLLVALLALEVELRQERGDRPTLEEYLVRFPGEESLVRAVFPTTGTGDFTEDLYPSPNPPTHTGLPERIGRYRIEGLAGQGGFGLVYRAHDEQLDRPVAVKVPHARLVSRPEDAEPYLAEARTVASLEHPYIVPVYDVGSTDQFPCFVVSKFIDGMDLKTRVKQERHRPPQTADLVATVAEALHYAHKRGLVHRDIKPGNILIDRDGKPYVVDFGLALREQDLGKGHRYAGTPAYMSPEQARGEGHRVDGRSDIFSLGVVFYELLTARRPFTAEADDKDEARNELLDLIATAEPRPPRQIDDAIPKELERICLKALSKRATDRYTTAHDLAEDLRAFLGTAAATVIPVVPDSARPPLGPTQEATPVPSTSRPSDSAQEPVRIVPKGLRPFDEHDADFFLELLPGPRDRDGLPESIRFWKRKIEQVDPDKTFRVGLIYGPSGCGKSSLVKAGLLPRLPRHVSPVYVEATLDETETRLLKAVRKACPDLFQGPGLAEALAELRRGRLLRSGQKVLLVLDQFEQWLFARRGTENTELVAALRQCDGEHVQAVVMVRDDFWMAATRFMRDLEIPLHEGENSAAVDLFDLLHARRVLTAFGHAYGVLPDKTFDLTPEHHAFLDQSIAGLAQDGKVISVRLALFAEMVKGKPWSPAILKEVGGTEGVGITFLEETFGASNAPPEHRLHQKAAQIVLKALLPQTGTDIKGQMRSATELRDASGYASRPRDFDDLVHILDHELRLITPTDPEGSAVEEQSAGPGGERYYQLTHDYLVHSLRDWLTRRRRETRRGRAELRLAERAALWWARPENRLLPSVLEWANIRMLTKKREWTEPQRRMMRRAARVHGLRGLGLAILIAVATWGGVEGYGNLRAAALVESLKTANIRGVPALIEQLRTYRRWAGRPLAGVLANTESNSDPHLRASLASLALFPGDGRQADYLSDRLMVASPVEVPVIWGILRKHHPEIHQRLRPLLDDPKSDPKQRFHAACALANTGSAPGEKTWDSLSPFITDQFLTAVIQNPGDYATLIETLRPLRKRLLAPLASIFRDTARAATERNFATTILADYACDDPNVLAELLMVADFQGYRTLFPVAEREAARALAVLRAELAKTADPTWNDSPPDPSWTKPAADLLSRIESAQGLVADRFAFCQTMPLAEFLTVAEALRKSGYRPVRLRPFADGPTVQVAAVWTRDGRSWRMGPGQTTEEVRRGDARNQMDRFIPVDVAGYVAIDPWGKPNDRYAALWVERAGPDDDSRMYVGVADTEHTAAQDRLRAAKMVAVTVQAMPAADGRMRFCSVWRKTATTEVPPYHWNLAESKLTDELALQTGQTLIDLSVAGAPPPSSTKERTAAALKEAEAALKANPNNLGARLARATAFIRLGEHRKALDDLNVVLGKAPQDGSAIKYRAMVYARLGQKKEALEDLAKFQKGAASESSGLYLAVVIAAELGDGQGEAFAQLEAALKRQPSDSSLGYTAACAYALAAQALAKTDRPRSANHAERAIGLLQAAISKGYSDYGHIQEDSDLDPIRERPAFAELMKGGHSDRRYAAVWNRDPRFESTAGYGLDPAIQLKQCRDLMAQEYRPVSLSVFRTAPQGPPVTASVWHRPVVAEEVKDRLAERQARAAAALVRLGHADAVWPFLRHGPDPRLRSFVVNWLSSLGVDPKTVITELDRLDSPAVHHPLPATEKMDAILFQPETSIRRALILALGTYGAAELSPGERQSLIAKLLDLYRNDPDAGIHGAAEWVLRQWNEDESLGAAEAALSQLKDRGDRRWFVNSQGQTFTIIDGPVEFRMGSPPTEPDRDADETPHRQVIPRRFAIAAKELSVEQYDRFVKENPRFRFAQSYLDKYSPKPYGPMIGVSWFGAAAYCNWLSEQEGLPRDQWCYLRNERGEYDKGMKLPADVFRRKGYRLPTDAEWEYACRAGAMTSRHYGLSVDFLGKYAWYVANSHDHAWPGGSLLPNDLGLSDMLGNVIEWCQDRRASYQLEYMRTLIDDIIDDSPRLLRGAAFSNSPSNVRSAFFDWIAPAYLNNQTGFRPARTYD